MNRGTVVQDVAVPVGPNSPTIPVDSGQICSNLAELSRQPGQEGLVRTLGAILNQLRTPGESTLAFTIMSGRVQAAKLEVKTSFEEVYFRAEVAGAQAPLRAAPEPE